MPQRDTPDTSKASRGIVSRVPALERGFAVLTELTDSGPLSLAALVERTGLNKSTAFYTLRTLDDLQAVRYDAGSRTYSLGPALVGLGNAAAQQFEPLAAARRVLPPLTEELEATVVLYRRLGIGEVAILDRFERDHGVHITVAAGARLPIQGGSFGRAFLAFDPAAVAKGALAPGLARFTERSTTNPTQFRRELREVRERGWAVDHEGFALGVSTVAAPIFGVDGQVQLVAAAVGFTSRFTDDVVTSHAQRLRAAGDEIGRPFSSVCAGRS